MGSDTSKHEPTLTELLSDPMMPLVFARSGLSRDDVRALIREIGLRRATQSASEPARVVDGDHGHAGQFGGCGAAVCRKRLGW